MKIIEIIILVIMLLGVLIGLKKGAVKEIFELIGTVAILIISFLLKSYLSALLIKTMPFFNFKGYVGLYSLNFLIYDVISFVIVFVLLYCILNILINIAGFIDYLVKLSLVYNVLSKIVGATLGLVNGLIFVFVALYIMLQIPYTQKYVMESSMATKIVERMPVLNVTFSKGILVGEDVYLKLKDYSFNEEDVENMNITIATSVAKYALVEKPLIQASIDNGKLHLNHVIIA